MSQQDSKFREFSDFQTAFFTNPAKFDTYTLFEVKKHGFLLLNNIGKGFPAISNIITNLRGIGWDGITSPEILKALQKRLHNPYAGNKLPSYLFFKTEKSTLKGNATKIVDKKGKKVLEFSPQVIRDICDILIIDDKDYKAMSHTDIVQRLGKQLIGDIVEKKQVKKKR